MNALAIAMTMMVEVVVAVSIGTILDQAGGARVEECSDLRLSFFPQAQAPVHMALLDAAGQREGWTGLSPKEERLLNTDDESCAGLAWKGYRSIKKCSDWPSALGLRQTLALVANNEGSLWPPRLVLFRTLSVAGSRYRY